MIYFDWAATALPDESIYRQSMELALQYPGNPSSLHQLGKKSRAFLEELRARTAQCLSCRPDQLILTSCGTESNNLVIYSLLNRTSPGEIVYSSLEHPSVKETVKSLEKFGAKTKELQPERDGRFSPEKLAGLLNSQTRLVTLMGVHNTTGVIQPIKELVQRVRKAEEGRRPIHFHCDLVQRAGKADLFLEDWDLDSASFSGHKLGAPQGTGLLYLKKPLPTLNRGGGQEQGIRSGTESLMNMASLTLALEKAAPGSSIAPIRELSDYLINSLQDALPDIVFNPPARATKRDLFVPHIINFSIPPIPGEVLHRVLDMQGFALSHGSACAANGRKKPEDLHSMGIHPKVAHCSIRVSLGLSNTKREIDQLVETLKDQVKLLGF